MSGMEFLTSHPIQPRIFSFQFFIPYLSILTGGLLASDLWMAARYSLSGG